MTFHKNGHAMTSNCKCNHDVFVERDREGGEELVLIRKGWFSNVPALLGEKDQGNFKPCICTSFDII